MKYIRCIWLVWLGLIMCGSALVHMVPAEKGGKAGRKLEKGCQTPMGHLNAGEEINDDKTCGIFVCQDDDGNGLYQFCQSPVNFANCEFDLVNTKGQFPDCCWECVTGIPCPESKPSTPKTFYL
ncbi:uncharacterized protein LOC6580207 [Drosophila mojavensis]|uniref:Single domain-containing protein n=1 Tax=Drosophila mojavensis TaxID=7230 RepID=B4KNL5_DROMO|nr:uncharacterized protein LOC6580207 [Drosophila mojavensis]EDW10000.2 uncharacterized protein Dmoj_GI18756 [Drosophila mojavensis]